MIELSDRKYWLKRCTYNEAIIYCAMLEIDGKKGWRLFKNAIELLYQLEHYPCWLETDFGTYDSTKTYSCIPVRDIDHD